MKQIFYSLIFVFLLLSGAAAQKMPTVAEIMREPSIAGMRAESARISPDGKFVIFSWNAENKEPRNLYIVPTAGGEPRILVNAEQNFDVRTPPPENKLGYGLQVRDEFMRAREKNIFGADISPDSKRLLFSQNTDIYLLDLTNETAKPRRLTRTQGFEAAPRWLDNDRIMFQSNGNYFVLNTREVSVVQVTREANPASFISIQGTSSSENAEFFAYSVSDGSRQRPLNVPYYLDEFVQSPTFRRGFTEQKVYVARTDGTLEKSFEINLPKSEGAGYIRRIEWTADNSALLVDRIDRDTKRRQLFYVTKIGTKDENAALVIEETDEKWIGSLSRLLEVNPRDASEFIFGSEKDGFNHLYSAKISATNAPQITQLTNGKFEVDWAKWSKSGQIIFSSTEENTAERQFYALDAATRQKTKLSSGENGMRNNPQVSENADQPFLLYELSTWNKPGELFAVQLCPTCSAVPAPRQLTKTAPAGFLQRKWNAPKFIDIPSRDGKPIKAKIYTPNGFNKKRKYPAVFFVHGAGYLQNTINGWNNYYREFMFNQLLTEKGFVVLDIDYRGSAGYGRDWRTDVYDFLGGKDLDDHLDVIDYAVKYNNVNPQKIGVYGGSYGGFMAGMLILRAPDKIAAAAALRPVFDWKNYYYSSPVYTTERLGTPEKNPEAYKRSSPISYAENLRKPFLILHGLVDDNVPAQDSIQMTEKLIRLEKTPYFDTMLYPSENHGFVRPTSWTDEYLRISQFLERHLK